MFKHDPAVHEQHPRTFWELYGTGDISRTNTNTQTYKYDSTPPFSPIHPPPLHLSSVSLSVPVDVHRVVSEAFKQLIVHIPKYLGEGLTPPLPLPGGQAHRLLKMAPSRGRPWWNAKNSSKRVETQHVRLSL